MESWSVDFWRDTTHICTSCCKAFEVILKLFGVVIAVKWINNPNQPSSFLGININSTAKSLVLLTQTSKLRNFLFNLSHQKAVINQIAFCQKVYIALKYSLQRRHIRFKTLDNINLLHVLPKVIVL